MTSFRYDAYVFDLDGTLIDASGPIGKGLVRALEHAGVAGVTPESTHHWIGRPLSEIFTDYLARNGRGELTEELFEAMVSAYRKGHDAVYPSEMILYPGVGEVLDRLRAAGKPTAVATTKFQEAAEYCMAGAGLAPRVDAILGTEPHEPVKPDPLVIQKALKALGARPESTLVVGDTAGDILAAHAAGCHGAAVRYGFGDKDALQAARPEHWLDRLTDLP